MIGALIDMKVRSSLLFTLTSRFTNKLCLFCICMYLHCSFDNTVLAYEQNVWGPDGLCVHCASLAARPKHQFANRIHYIFRKKYSFESRQSNADMNEIKYKIYEEIHNIHINFVVVITINCIICFSCLLLFIKQKLLRISTK